MATCNFTRLEFSIVYVVEDGDEDEWKYVEEDVVESLSSILPNFSAYETSYDNYHEIGTIERTINNYDVTFHMLLIGGYYSDANLEVKIEAKDTYEGIEFDKEGLPPSVQKKVQQTVNRIEKAYAKVSTPIRHVATFSNGEAMYERINK